MISYSRMQLFFCGDVMLGRGIDQIMKYKNDPILYENYYRNATQYVTFNLKKYTNKNQFVSYEYIWGDLYSDQLFIDSIKFINLETSITTSTDHYDKMVLYKMHPKNIEILVSAKIDYCCMANNHVLDWGRKGLSDTITTLTNHNINFGGIGLNENNAYQPTIIYRNDIKIIIFSYGSIDSGIPLDWKATPTKSGVNLININDPTTKNKVLEQIRKFTQYQKNYLVIFSIHWGSNKGWDVPSIHQEFARYLIDNANVDIIHGHSSHHFRPIEIYREKIIFYGCGDLINDYEDIYHPDDEKYMIGFSIAYYLILNKNDTKLIIKPYFIKNMRLNQISNEQVIQVCDKFNKICQKYGSKFNYSDGKIVLDVHHKSKYVY